MHTTQKGISINLKYYLLRSEKKSCESFEMIGLEDYCLSFDQGENKICKIILINPSNCEPYKYCMTWRENLIPFSKIKEERYVKIERPRIVKMDHESITICLKGKAFALKLVEQLIYRVNQKIIITDPTNPCFSKKGIIEDAKSDIDYLRKNEFVPLYKIRFDDGSFVFLKSFQIQELS